MDHQTKALTKAVADLETMNMQQKIHHWHNQLVVNQVRGRLPEQIFRDYFLPYFQGLVKNTPERNYVVEWISIAGSPMSEVDILDPAGNVLFTVPSMYNTNHFNTGAGQEIKRIMEEHRLRANVTPAMGVRYINQHLGNKIEQIVSGNKADSESVERWKAIHARYQDPSTQVKAQPSQTYDPADDFID